MYSFPLDCQIAKEQLIETGKTGDSVQISRVQKE